MKQAPEPFLFKSQASLVELTGLKAKDLVELSHHLKQVPESCVYYHTHHFLRQHEYLTPEPPNDFAYWVSGVLQEEAAGERLAAIDTVRFDSLKDLREALVEVMDAAAAGNKVLRQAPEGEEFHFMRSIVFTLPTSYKAFDLNEFLECLKHVGIGCLYNHIFEGRLRPPLGVGDFSHWLEHGLGEKELARRIERLDPYTHTMDGLRKKIIHLIEKRLGSEDRHAPV